ncbi:hypothetical protein KUTeg_021646, partial [Tegillarca granosa]
KFIRHKPVTSHSWRPPSFLLISHKHDRHLTGNMPNLGDVFPDFEADTTHGKIKFHDWLGDSWGILFSHPADYTPVCTTELGMVIKNMSEFEKRGVKVIALSCDDVESHKGWAKDIEGYIKCGEMKYPIISDVKRELAVKLGMLDPVEKDKGGLPLTCRARGENCMVIPSVSTEEAKKLFSKVEVVDVKSGKPYLRMTPDPEFSEGKK